jgi:hypothetical protein
MDPRWPGRPQLQLDESFASWLARAAAANGLRPGELYRIVQPGEDRNPRDLDRYADDHLVDRLAESTGADKRRLKLATFRRWTGKLFDNDYSAQKLAWLPPAGRVGGKRCHGQQFCPECLASDAAPYLRLTWRLSFITVCPIHKRLLLDRCPHCGEPFNVLRQDSRGPMSCWSCGVDLGQSRCEPPPVDAETVQAELLAILDQGWMDMGAYGPVHSISAFDILDHLTRLLSSGRYALALRAWIAAREPALALPPETIPRAREGVLLATRARSVLVPMAYWLMAAWPTRFISAALAVGLSKRDLLKRADERYPYAFAHAVDWHLTEHSGRRAEVDEVAAAKTVLRNRGQPANWQNLASLLGGKPAAISAVAELPEGQAHWGQGRYWKLDGVSPEVKAAARAAAHRTGEGVGPWLDSLLRRELGISAQKTPCARQSPDTFAADGISGCAE